MSYFQENIDKLAGYVPGFQPGSADVVKLNTNENTYPPSPKVLAAVAGITAEQLRRYPKPLGDDFRVAAAKLHGLEPENIICVNGGDDLLTICLRAFCGPAAAVAYPSPTYSLYPVLAGLQNCESIEVPYGGGWALPVEELAAAKAGLTIVCNPNAPSGTFTEPKQLAELAGKLAGRGVLLIDEAYVDFAKGSCIALVKEFDNVIILRSMSKGYSLAGLRFGYGIGPKELIAGLMKVKDSYNVDAISIAVATAAIKDQKYFSKNVEKVKSERERLTIAMREMGFAVPDSDTNFILAQYDGDTEQLYNKLVRMEIFVRYFKIDGLRDKLRITVGTKEQNDKLIAALKKR